MELCGGVEQGSATPLRLYAVIMVLEFGVVERIDA
jgi:hypothetical protein